MPRQPDLLPDWFVGGAGKRRLMRAVLDAGPDRRWTEQELADAAELGRKNSAPRHVAVLVQARILRERNRRYRLNPRSPLLGPLDRYLTALEEGIPADPLPPSRGGGRAE
jgi:hypothetical protein